MGVFPVIVCGVLGPILILYGMGLWELGVSVSEEAPVWYEPAYCEAGDPD